MQNNYPRGGNRSLTDLGKFNNNLDKLFTTLETAYPSDPDLPYYKDKILAARKINSRMVVEQFLEAVEPYIEQIMRKDVNFFVTLDLQGVVEDNSYIKLIRKIKTLWDNMTLTSHEQIWRYFQIFVTLGIKINKRHDLLSTLNKYRTVPLVM